MAKNDKKIENIDDVIKKAPSSDIKSVIQQYHKKIADGSKDNFDLEADSWIMRELLVPYMDGDPTFDKTAEFEIETTISERITVKLAILVDLLHERAMESIREHEELDINIIRSLNWMLPYITMTAEQKAKRRDRKLEEDAQNTGKSVAFKSSIVEQMEEVRAKGII